MSQANCTRPYLWSVDWSMDNRWVPSIDICQKYISIKLWKWSNGLRWLIDGLFYMSVVSIKNQFSQRYKINLSSRPRKWTMVYQSTVESLCTSVVSIRELILKLMKNNLKCRTRDNIYGTSIKWRTVDESHQSESAKLNCVFIFLIYFFHCVSSVLQY